MKNILVATDFSKAATNATELAITIAKLANAELHFLHVIITPVDWEKLDKEDEHHYPDVLKEIGHARDHLSQLVQSAEKSGLTVKQFLYFNKETKDLIKHIWQHHHDFIFIGSHGQGYTKGVLMGSTAQQIVRHSPCPVLTVKNEPFRSIKNIVFASSFEEDVHLPFQRVLEFAEITGAQIHLLYVNTPFQFEESHISEGKMQEFLNKCPKGTCSLNVYNALNEERGIIEFVNKVKADIISLTTHGKTGFIKLLSHSIAESLVMRSNCAVLTINID